VPSTASSPEQFRHRRSARLLIETTQLPFPRRQLVRLIDLILRRFRHHPMPSLIVSSRTLYQLRHWEQPSNRMNRVLSQRRLMPPSIVLSRVLFRHPRSDRPLTAQTLGRFRRRL
jgi:hypothetical protein